MVPRQLHPYYIFLFAPHNTRNDRTKENHSTTDYGLFHTHFRVWYTFIFEDSTLTAKIRTARKSLFLFLQLCLYVMTDILCFSKHMVFFLWGFCVVRIYVQCMMSIIMMPSVSVKPSVVASDIFLLELCK